MFEGYQNLPLPPPWRYVSFDTDGVNGSEVHYMNDITNDITTVHPLLRLIAERKEAEELKSNSVIDEILDYGDRVTNGGGISRPETANTESNGTSFLEGSRNLTYCEFKCVWKEIGLFRERSVLGLTIRYNTSDARISVRFDGSGGEWEYPSLDGPYGPVTRNDLFIGSKIKIFGKTLTISVANREAIEWIQKEYKKMLAHQSSMQKRIEKCGSVPVVTRMYVPPSLSVRRDGLGFGGKCDLRKLHNENARLGEQLVTIGISP